MLIKRLLKYRSGCNSISYGIESMDQTVLKVWKRRLGKGRSALALTDKNNYSRKFVFGDPVEAVETANNI